ncbi:sialin [Eurytemora carolleeae]|uniref:sialin n=1 Tax=Eurytemora carolleeae TaxID=1294199 RepID=UPI000C77FCC4|nr:sialin [Eurytemora carolleeae]|eukprot:XP_023338852.1 sialin-like [Eurytemora affinis]
MIRLPCRYVLTALGFVGFVFNYTLRININLIITSMTKSKTNTNTTTTELEENLFDWDNTAQTIIMSSFYWGYVVFQMPGGRMAEIIGGKKVIGAALGLTAALTLLIPEAAKLGGFSAQDFPYYLVAIRVIMGLCEGVTFPAMTSMMARWAPASERSRMTFLVMAGGQIGTIVGFFISGIIVDYLGWEAAFYIEGGATFVWLALWIFLISDTPDTHPYISKAELEYIKKELPATREKSLPIPWRSMLTSMPLWAIFVANVANNWGFHLLMTELPQYLKEVFPDYMEKSSVIGLWTAIPYFSMWLCGFVFSFICDFLIKWNILSVKNSRKLFNTLSQTGPAICLLIIVLSVSNEEPNLELTLAVFTIGVSLEGALYSGFITNPQDIAPNFAGTVLGITNCAGAVPGFVAPLIATSFVNDNPSDVDLWAPVWIIAIAILVAASLFYIIFADGVPQEWNYSEEEKQEKQAA